MKILYIGDIMAESGIKIVEQLLPQMRIDNEIDLVIAQAENVSGGRSMLKQDMARLEQAGVNFFTGGNHTPERSDIKDMLLDNNIPVIGPANMQDCPGRGWKHIDTPAGKVLVVSILGETFGKSPRPNYSNPLIKIDEILADNTGLDLAAIVVNIHGDYSSEKRVFGYYLDGKVSAVIGDHWHVPTADAMVLPNGTAHITDVGMCGVLHSSLGVELETIISRWKSGEQLPNKLATNPPFQFNAVLVETDNATKLAKSISPINKIV